MASFEAIWQHEVAWFEPPNERRGGWSGVGTMTLQANQHAPLRLFVKKQQNHGRKTLRRPIAGEPTFRREFQRLKFLESQAFAAPKVVFYAEDLATRRAILITEALENYAPLDQVTVQLFEHRDRAAQQRLLHAVAAAIRRFHSLGLVHRALYPKHIFVKNADTAPEIAIIDLEKARFSPFFLWRAYFDLSALHRHATSWQSAQRMRFLFSYLNTSKLNFWNKLWCKALLRRAAR